MNLYCLTICHLTVEASSYISLLHLLPAIRHRAESDLCYQAACKHSEA